MVDGAPEPHQRRPDRVSVARAASRGAEVVANLAESPADVPPTAVARYAFRLRRGIAYSTGEPVLAEPHPLRHQAGGAPGARSRPSSSRIRGARGLHAGALRSLPRHRRRRRGRDDRVPARPSRTRICCTSWRCRSRSHCRRASGSRHRPAGRCPRPGRTASPSSSRARFVRLERNPGSDHGRRPRVPTATRMPSSSASASSARRRRRSRARRTRRSHVQPRRAAAAAAGHAPAARAGAAARVPSAHTTWFVLNTRRAPFDRLDARGAPCRSRWTAAPRSPRLGGRGRRTRDLPDPAAGLPRQPAVLPVHAARDRRRCGPSRSREGAPARAAVGHAGDARDRARPECDAAGPRAAHDAHAARTRLRRGAPLAAARARHFATLADTRQAVPDRPDAVVRRLSGALRRSCATSRARR